MAFSLMPFLTPLLLITPLLESIRAAPTAFSIGPYAPKPAHCPAPGNLVRPASTGLSSSESSYISARKAKASASLAAWASKVDPAFKAGEKMPSVALTTSGGGYRALLTGAGVIQGFDGRDSSTGTSGLYQGITYEAGLSGGSWMLSSIAGNNWPTVSSLRDNLWGPAFQDSLLVASFLSDPKSYGPIALDVLSKDLAGFDPTLTDPWGRALSYQLLYGKDGGVADTLSGITALSNFTSANVPYPIITALGVNTFQGACIPALNATQYELHPYEFGSWDSGVAAFANSKYLGSTVNAGKGSKCFTNYDNLGYVLGTSSTLFNELCAELPTPDNSTLQGVLASIISLVDSEISQRDLYATYPNPFYNYPPSSLVSGQKELDLVDGGEADQGDPVWPFLQSARKPDVDVLLITAASADTPDNFPNGSDIRVSYEVSMREGLNSMPAIPDADEFVAKGLNKRATFFGCNDHSKLTIVYLPNVNYTFPSNESTFKVQYSKEETNGMIANGALVATQNGDKQWPTCLACGIMKKSGGTLPAACTACFAKYCYN